MFLQTICKRLRNTFDSLAIFVKHRKLPVYIQYLSTLVRYFSISLSNLQICFSKFPRNIANLAIVIRNNQNKPGNQALKMCPEIDCNDIWRESWTLSLCK